MSIIIRRMWSGGPLRQWSPSKIRPRSGFITCSFGGHSGEYVCDECSLVSDGVYFVRPGRWLCGACKTNLRESLMEQLQSKGAA
jgi:hypothetical protein